MYIYYLKLDITICDLKIFNDQTYLQNPEGLTTSGRISCD
jgi:hypothetical protein